MKERHLVRVAGVYTVTAWGVFQIAKTVFETFDLPKYLPALTLLLLALGLPIALAVYWTLTRRKARAAAALAEAADGEAPARPRFDWIDWAVTAVIALVAVVTLTTMVGLVRNLQGGETAGLTLGPASKSVAVLPFANFSSAADAEYFADGLTEEVTNTLAEIPELKVAGRTSAFYFKGKNEDLREIGRKLNVAHVVEGSVRRSGERLRITCQLVSVKDGFNVWSETYDRTMDDAFAIQAEIADGVADALKVELDANDRPQPAAAPRDPDAYRLQVVAKGLILRKGKAQMESAQSILRQLMEKDPENAQVHADYAFTTAYLAQNHLEGDFTLAVRDAEAQANKALELDPKLADAYVAKGMINAIRFIREGLQASEQAAENAYRKAVELAPRNAEALAIYGDYISDRHPVRAVTYLKQALEIDPLNRVANNALAGALHNSGRDEEAKARLLANIDLFPEYVDAKQALGHLLTSMGRLDEAVPWLKAAAEPMTDPSASIELANVYYNMGMPQEAEAVLAQWKDHPLVGPLGEAIKLIVAQKFTELRTFLQAKLAEPDPDPVWRSGLTLTGMMLGDYENARQQFLAVSPELFQPAPQVSINLLNDSVDAAYVLEKTGDRAQSRRVLEAVLAVTEPTAEHRQSNSARVARVKAYAMLGDKEKAIAELRGAINGGYRQLRDLDLFVRLDDYPMIAPLRSDPRFKALIRQIEADNAKMRARLKAASPAPPVKKAA